MKRDITKIIKFLKDEVIPGSELSLRSELDHVAGEACYHSPEQQGNDWLNLSVMLGRVLGMPDVPWKQRVADVMMGKETVPDCLLPS